MPGLRTEQDTFTKEEFCKLIQSEKLERGQYTIDVGSNEDIKFSRVKKLWINKEDFSSNQSQS